MKLFVLLCLLLALTDIHCQHSGDITKAGKTQRDQIANLILKWKDDSVTLFDSKKTIAKFTARFNGNNVEYRLDREEKVKDKYAKYRIQSNERKPVKIPTYGVVLIAPNHDFGKHTIQEAFTKSVRSGALVTLDLPKLYGYNAADQNDEEVNVDIADEDIGENKLIVRQQRKCYLC